MLAHEDSLEVHLYCALTFEPNAPLPESVAQGLLVDSLEKSRPQTPVNMNPRTDDAVGQLPVRKLELLPS